MLYLHHESGRIICKLSITSKLTITRKPTITSMHITQTTNSQISASQWLRCLSRRAGRCDSISPALPPFAGEVGQAVYRWLLIRLSGYHALDSVCWRDRLTRAAGCLQSPSQCSNDTGAVSNASTNAPFKSDSKRP